MKAVYKEFRKTGKVVNALPPDEAMVRRLQQQLRALRSNPRKQSAES